MPKISHLNLGKRERQIMEIIYQKGRASVAEVLETLPDPPSYSAVRTMLRILEEKGYLKHKQVGRKYVFLPMVARDKVRRSVLRNLLKTFFEESVEQVVASLLDLKEQDLSNDELNKLSQLIDKARKEEH